VLVWAIAIQFVVFAAMIAVITLYVHTSLGQYALLLLAAGVLQGLFTATSARFFAARLGPAIEWLRGERDQRAAEAAWEAAASLPVEFFRRQIRKLAPLAYNVIWCSFAVWELDLPGYGLLILVAIGAPVFLFAISVLFLLMERSLRPLLEELSEAVPAEVELRGAGIPLRARLLATLPAMNVVAGVVVAGVAGIGNGTVARLGLVVLVSFGIALALALALALLLSDSIVAPVTRLRDATERVGGGDLTVEIPVISTDETGELTGSFNRMVSGLAERERIREAFGTYVDKEVAEHILSEGTSLAGEEVEVTLMFIDIRDFTGFSERATAPEVVATINRMFERAVPVIHAHRGHVDKFVGDGLLAVFGAPRRQEDHADRALAAALEIDRAVAEEFGGELSVGVGLNSGMVVAGNVGGGGRLEFSVIGDAVNVAARVEAATRKTGDVILLAENVERLLRSTQITLEERPGVPLKGKSEAIMLYAPSAPVPIARPETDDGQLRRA
jgi:class 3 adenylate cyclase